MLPTSPNKDQIHTSVALGPLGNGLAIPELATSWVSPTPVPLARGRESLEEVLRTQVSIAHRGHGVAAEIERPVAQANTGQGGTR